MNWQSAEKLHGLCTIRSRRWFSEDLGTRTPYAMEGPQDPPTAALGSGIYSSTAREKNFRAAGSASIIFIAKTEVVLGSLLRPLTVQVGPISEKEVPGTLKAAARRGPPPWTLTRVDQHLRWYGFLKGGPALENRSTPVLFCNQAPSHGVLNYRGKLEGGGGGSRGVASSPGSASCYRKRLEPGRNV